MNQIQFFSSPPTAAQIADTVDEGCYILEPQESDNRAVVGYIRAENKLIYGYEELIISMAEFSGCSTDEALEHIHYNTLRALPYMPSDKRPIIVFNAVALKLAYENSIAEKSEIPWQNISLEYLSQWGEQNTEQLNAISLFCN